MVQKQIIINKFEKYRRFSWMITIILAITIFILSSIDFGPLLSGGGYGYKSIIYHFGIFFLLSFFLLNSLKARISWRIFFLGLIITIFYGVLDEVHQLFVTNRVFSLKDIFIDFLGSITASFFYLFFLKKN